MRTEWKEKEIWIRREIELPARVLKNPHLLIHHDEDAEIFLNGIRAAGIPGFTTDYEEVPVSAAAASALKPGKNVIAVHCRQTGGGQYIDVGLVEVGE